MSLDPKASEACATLLAVLATLPKELPWRVAFDSDVDRENPIILELCPMNEGMQHQVCSSLDLLYTEEHDVEIRVGWLLLILNPWRWCNE